MVITNISPGVVDNTPGPEASVKSSEAPLNNLLLKAVKNDRVIYGPASWAGVDKERDIITGDALREALPQLFRRKYGSAQHTDILPYVIIPEFKTADGRLLKTEVRPITKQDLTEFPSLKEAGAYEGDDCLFLLGKFEHDDAHFVDEFWKHIESGKVSGYSISGQARVASQQLYCDKGGKCQMANVISKIDLSTCTICLTPMNPACRFKIVSKGESYMCGCGGKMTKAEVTVLEPNEGEKHEGCQCGGNGTCVCTSPPQPMGKEEMLAAKAGTDDGIQSKVGEAAPSGMIAQMCGKSLDRLLGRTFLGDGLNRILEKEGPKHYEDCPEGCKAKWTLHRMNYDGGKGRKVSVHNSEDTAVRACERMADMKRTPFVVHHGKHGHVYEYEPTLEKSDGKDLDRLLGKSFLGDGLDRIEKALPNSQVKGGERIDASQCTSCGRPSRITYPCEDCDDQLCEECVGEPCHYAETQKDYSPSPAKFKKPSPGAARVTTHKRGKAEASRYGQLGSVSSEWQEANKADEGIPGTYRHALRPATKKHGPEFAVRTPDQGYIASGTVRRTPKESFRRFQSANKAKSLDNLLGIYRPGEQLDNILED